MTVIDPKTPRSETSANGPLPAGYDPERSKNLQAALEKHRGKIANHTQRDTSLDWLHAARSNRFLEELVADDDTPARD